ncbi:MAG: hypothetical protein AAF721_00870 [Myxococcota bacterium]
MLDVILPLLPYAVYLPYLLTLLLRVDVVRDSYAEDGPEPAREILQNPKDVRTRSPTILRVQVDPQKAERLATNGDPVIVLVHGPVPDSERISVAWPATDSDGDEDRSHAVITAPGGMRPLATWTLRNYAALRSVGNINVERSFAGGWIRGRVLRRHEARRAQLRRPVAFALFGGAAPLLLTLAFPGPSGLLVDSAIAAAITLPVSGFLAWFLGAPRVDIAQGYRGTEASMTHCRDRRVRSRPSAPGPAFSRR